MQNNHSNLVFPGFPPKPITNFWSYPKALNGWWKNLTAYEQKVLDYLLRHTWGYEKNEDAISYSQFISDMIKRDGTPLDGGTGIKDERTIRKALKGLKAKGFIVIIPQSYKENLYRLRITPSQDMIPPAKNDTPHPTQDVRGTSQDMSPTINTSINNINTIPAKQDDIQKYQSKITQVISYLSDRLGGFKFPNYGKQAKFTKSILSTGYSVDDICWAIDKMLENPWWNQQSFDMKNVADEIPKLMTRTFKEGKK